MTADKLFEELGYEKRETGFYITYRKKYESVMVVKGEKVASTKNELRWLDD